MYIIHYSRIYHAESSLWDAPFNIVPAQTALVKVGVGPFGVHQQELHRSINVQHINLEVRHPHYCSG